MNASGSTSHSITFTITVDDVVVYLRLLQRRLNTIGVILGIVIMGIGSMLAVITNDASTWPARRSSIAGASSAARAA